MTILQDVSTEIRVLLARSSMSQRDLATHLGLSQVAVSRRMTGATPWGIVELESVADLFGVPVRSLVPERARTEAAS